MRKMHIAIAAVTLALTVTQILSAQNPGSPNATQADTLTGCLKGSSHQYYVIEQSGKRHTVMMRNGQDLGSYVNHKVTLTGKAQSSRNAAASDAEGHRKGFFAADSVNDEGACKK